MNALQLRYIKWVFGRSRETVYQALGNSISQTGTKRQELMSDTFKRWADRDAKRGKMTHYAYRAIQKRLEAGKPLSEAMSPFIPVGEMLTIQSGETGGIQTGDKPKLAQAIESAKRQKLAADEMKAAVRGAMAEPVAQLFIFFLMSLGYGAFVWPEMVQAFPLAFWPDWCVPFVEMQIWMSENWFYFLLTFIVVGWYYWSLPNWTGSLRARLDKFPPYSIYRDRLASALLGSLGGLLHGGLTLNEALKRIEDNATPYLRWHVIRMNRLVPQSGDEPVKALSTGLFSRDILDQIDDAASSREFDETLTHIGQNALSSIINVVKKSVVAANVSILVIVAFMFLYMTAVQIVGVQDASDKFISSGGSTTVKIQ